MELQTGIRSFELSVKESLAVWDRQLKALKQDPHLSTQKRLWVEFVNNPKLLEANVEAMMKKAASLK